MLLLQTDLLRYWSWRTRKNEMHTDDEYCEMVLLYGQCNRNKREVARLYAIKFHSRRHPSSWTIVRAVQCLYKTGIYHKRIPLSRATLSSLRIPVNDVVGYALAHPESSVRDISNACSYDGVEHITYVRCISLSYSPGPGTNADRPVSSFWFLQFRVKHTEWKSRFFEWNFVVGQFLR